MTGGAAAAAALPAPRLEVHRVGSFEASFVPTVDDFERLDPRFRLPPAVWDDLPAYRDWGFAVFKLRDLFAAEATAVEPMAFEFPRRDPGALFFPTVHVHDGRAHAAADFDHNLFLQTDGEEELTIAVGNHARRAGESAGPAREFTSPLRARGLLLEDRRVQVARFAGTLANHDAWSVAPSADPDFAALDASTRADHKLPAARAVDIVARLATARAGDAVTAATRAASAALAEFVPSAQQAPSWYGSGGRYASPESVLAKPTDERSEVYSVAALLFHLVAGRSLFGEGLHGMAQHIVAAPPALDGPLDPVVRRALAKDPAQRQPTLRALVEELRALRV